MLNSARIIPNKEDVHLKNSLFFILDLLYCIFKRKQKTTDKEIYLDSRYISNCYNYFLV